MFQELKEILPNNISSPFYANRNFNQTIWLLGFCEIFHLVRRMTSALWHQYSRREKLTCTKRKWRTVAAVLSLSFNNCLGWIQWNMQLRWSAWRLIKLKNSTKVSGYCLSFVSVIISQEISKQREYSKETPHTISVEKNHEPPFEGANTFRILAMTFKGFSSFLRYFHIE